MSIKAVNKVMLRQPVYDEPPPKVNRQAVQEWVNLLRSDEFTQIRRKLGEACTDNRCANGLACEVAVSHRVVKRLDDLPQHTVIFYGKSWQDAEWQRPVVEVIEFFGLPNYVFDRVMTMNDHQNFSFSEIADYLEVEYLK
jgi:hypothetical protein